MASQKGGSLTRQQFQCRWRLSQRGSSPVRPQMLMHAIAHMSQCSFLPLSCWEARKQKQGCTCLHQRALQRGCESAVTAAHFGSSSLSRNAGACACVRARACTNARVGSVSKSDISQCFGSQTEGAESLLSIRQKIWMTRCVFHCHVFLTSAFLYSSLRYFTNYYFWFSGVALRAQEELEPRLRGNRAFNYFGKNDTLLDKWLFRMN